MDGLVKDCGIFIANALEILQSYTKPSIFIIRNHVCTGLSGDFQEPVLLTWIYFNPSMDK